MNLLRAYDVLSNVFSLNQADLIVERAPDLTRGRRYGARIDLQFGQATATLQGNPPTSRVRISIATSSRLMGPMLFRSAAD